MNSTLSRRKLLFGGAALTGAAALDRLTGGLRLIDTAHADLAAPAVPIRMSSNENPFGPSPKAIQAMVDAFDESSLYGGVNGQILEVLSKIENVPPESITIGAGSGEILEAAAVLASLDPGSLVAPYPTFSQLTRTADAR